MAIFLVDELDDCTNLECQELDRLEVCQNSLTSNYNLRILTFNIRSLQHNFNTFCIALKRLNIVYDAIILTECWLRGCPVVSQIQGYTSYATVNNLNQCGGVVTYVRNCWNASVSEPDIQDAESLLLELSKDICLIAIYRSPSHRQIDNFISSFDKILNSISKYQTIIVTGDININLLSMSDKSASEFACLMSEHGLKQVISKPTRLDACLDHIFLKSRHPNVLGIICEADITDHKLVMMGYNTGNPFGNKCQRRTINIINFLALIEDLRNMDWNEIVTDLDVNTATNEFHRLLADAIKKHN